MDLCPPSSEHPELEIIGLTKKYGDFFAVQDMSLKVGPGEFLTILGASGSGKTTTLMMIAGFDYPSAGKIFFRNLNVTYMPAHRRNMGMVFQNYALFPHMTVFQNIAFPLKVRRATKAEINERLAAALDLVQLREHAHKMPAQLSGGQQQRVALARALVFGPSLLLMDEPLGALDKSLREQMQLEIKRVQAATGVTIISVTHDQDEALAMSDRIVVMDKGRIEAVGTPTEIYEQPTSLFVAEFMKETNILQGNIRRRNPNESIVEVCGRKIVASHLSAQGDAGTATLCMRPERLKITSETTARANQWPGRVLDVVYLGDLVKYHVDVENAEPSIKLIVKQLASRDRSVFARGDRIVVSWEPEDCQFLADARKIL